MSLSVPFAWQMILGMLERDGDKQRWKPFISKLVAFTEKEGGAEFKREVDRLIKIESRRKAELETANMKNLVAEKMRGHEKEKVQKKGKRHGRRAQQDASLVAVLIVSP